MAIALVNSAATGNTAASSTTIATPATSLTAGNLIVVAIRWTSGSSISSVTDTAGNTYTLLRQVVGSSTTLAIYYANDCLGNGSNVVTCTFAAGVSNRSIASVQFSGAAAYGTSTRVVQIGSTAAFAATDIAVGAITSTDALIVGACQVDATDQTWSYGSGLTEAVKDASAVLTLAYAILTSETTVVASFTSSSSQAKVAIVGTWPPSGGGGGVSRARVVNA